MGLMCIIPLRKTYLKLLPLKFDDLFLVLNFKIDELEYPKFQTDQ